MSPRLAERPAPPRTYPFRLQVGPGPDGKTRATLTQEESRSSGEENPAKQVRLVAIWGLAMEAARPAMAFALRRSGQTPTVLSRTQTGELPLTEDDGVRLGLTFLVLKPLRRPDRMYELVEAVAGMGREEALYWYAQCLAHRHKGPSALRLLLAARGGA